MKYINILFLIPFLVILGCSTMAGLSMRSDEIPSGLHSIARPAYPRMVADEKEKCLGGAYVGRRINDLLGNEKIWTNADSIKGPGKVYTFIYFSSVDSGINTKNWYEHWYQLHDYDLDGMVDECKYYRIFKGDSTTRSTFLDDAQKFREQKSRDASKWGKLKTI